MKLPRSALAVFMTMTPLQRMVDANRRGYREVLAAQEEGVVCRDVDVHGAERGALPRGRTRRRSTLCRSRETSWGRTVSELERTESICDSPGIFHTPGDCRCQE